MSGPTPMALGAFAFEAHGFGFQGLQRRVQTPWADVAVAQTLNQQQWTGPTSEEVTINGVVFQVEFGGQGSLDGIVAAANAGVPLMLVSGSEDEGIIHGIGIAALSQALGAQLVESCFCQPILCR